MTSEQKAKKREYDRAWRRRSPKYLENLHIRRETMRGFLQSLKSQVGCMRCGEDDYRVLELHHPDGDFAYRTGWPIGWPFYLRELRKCVVLCANCHLIAHFEEEA